MENVIIIGGGPAGLSAAIYNARAALNPLVFAGSPPGGQLMQTTEVENYPGFASILGPNLVGEWRKHAEKFNVRIIDENVIQVDFTKSPFKIKTISGEKEAKSVIIATGAKALWLNLPSEQRLRGAGVSACATCDGFFFKEKTVAVIGGGDTAMEEALTLTQSAKKIYIIHRRDQFRASKIMQDRILKHPKIEVIWNTEIAEVLGDKKVSGVKLKKTVEQLSNETILPLDGLFIAIGNKPSTEIFAGKIELDQKGYIVTGKNPDYEYMTSLPGVFAAGDCVDYKYRQAGVAVGMGIASALEVEKWLQTI